MLIELNLEVLYYISSTTEKNIWSSKYLYHKGTQIHTSGLKEKQVKWNKLPYYWFSTKQKNQIK